MKTTTYQTRPTSQSFRAEDHPLLEANATRFHYLFRIRWEDSWVDFLAEKKNWKRIILGSIWCSVYCLAPYKDKDYVFDSLSLANQASTLQPLRETWKEIGVVPCYQFFQQGKIKKKWSSGRHAQWKMLLLHCQSVC